MQNLKATGPVNVETLGSGIKEVVDDATDRVKDVAERGAEKLSTARAGFNGALKAVQTRAGEARRAAVAKAEAGANTCDTYVRHEPWKAVAVASGAGLIIGLLLARR